MPYKDKERQRAYNRAWWKRLSPERVAQNPLCQEVHRAVIALGPVGPTQIVEHIGRSNPNAVSVALHRLAAVGLVENRGYRKWVAL